MQANWEDQFGHNKYRYLSPMQQQASAANRMKYMQEEETFRGSSIDASNEILRRTYRPNKNHFLGVAAARYQSSCD
jgi:hypothetical protein